jgi:hypothetical protein
VPRRAVHEHSAKRAISLRSGDLDR